MQGAPPIIVRVFEEPVRTTTWAEVLLGAFGLAGVMILVGLALGLLLGGLLISYKRMRAKHGPESIPDSEAMRVTPSSSTT